MANADFAQLTFKLIRIDRLPVCFLDLYVSIIALQGFSNFKHLIKYEALRRRRSMLVVVKRSYGQDNDLVERSCVLLEVIACFATGFLCSEPVERSVSSEIGRKYFRTCLLDTVRLCQVSCGLLLEAQTDAKSRCAPVR